MGQPNEITIGSVQIVDLCRDGIGPCFQVSSRKEVTMGNNAMQFHSFNFNVQQFKFSLIIAHFEETMMWSSASPTASLESTFGIGREEEEVQITSVERTVSLFCLKYNGIKFINVNVKFLNIYAPHISSFVS